MLVGRRVARCLSTLGHAREAVPGSPGAVASMEGAALRVLRRPRRPARGNRRGCVCAQV
jgi:hypothetical protein